MDSFFDRLDLFMKKMSLNDNKISLQTGISNGLVGKARKRGSLSQENISKILLQYRNLNANWLLTGQGEMLINRNAEAKSNSMPYKDLADAREKIIMLQEEQIVYLKLEIARFKEMIESTL